MSKKTLFLSTNAIENLWEEIQYTPPKDSVDIGNFNDFFASGSYSLPDIQSLEGDKGSCLRSSPEEFYLKDEGNNESIKLNFTKHEKMDIDRLSIADSSKTGTHTITTASPESTHSTRSKINLGKRSPKKADWITLQINHANNIFPENTNLSNEKAFMVHTLFGTEMANERVTRLALRIIDHKGPITEAEWSILTPQDHDILSKYLFQLFSSRPEQDPNCLDIINKLLDIKLKYRRNEEKLNKTVKRVHAMMGRSFVDINQLEGISEAELAETLQAAYFGDESDESVFALNTVFSQKSWGKAVENSRYADDFEAVLKMSYIAELLENRYQKLLKQIKYLRKASQDGRDLTCQPEHNKRSPWIIEDIVDGARLCQNIIDKFKIS